MLNTGSARYGVKIALPPGVAGHNPGLSLNYESGFGDGPAGIGWKYGPGGISRQTDKGIPRYVEGPNGRDDDHDGEIDEWDETDRFIGLEGEELVQLADGTFRARIEGMFIQYRRIGDHWEAHLKDGTRLEFGLTARSRVADKTGTKIFKWLLEKSTDTNGNVISYYYADFEGSDNRKYLQEIRWGPGGPPWVAYYFAYCTYEERPDAQKDYRSGFLIRTGKRLKQIDVAVHGVFPEKCLAGDWNEDSETNDDALIRRYILSYDQNHHRSFLTEIKQFGSDGANYLPPISFAYSTFNPERAISAAGAVIGSQNTPVSVMDSELAELIDLNRDGLPDMLKTDLYGSRHRYYLNLGMNTDGATPLIAWDDARDVASSDRLALQLHLVDQKVHLADMDGNGLSDLIHTPYSQEVYYFPNQGDGSWGDRKRMSIQDTAPPPPFTDDDVKTSDLDFDKRMDVVRSTENGYTIWFSLEAGRYSREVRTAGASDGASVIRFSFTGVHLADMNGDRMNDVVRVRPSHLVYAANMGHGHFLTRPL